MGRVGSSRGNERDHWANGEDLLDALAATEEPPGTPLTVARLASATGRDPGLVRRVIDDLVELGLVERHPGSNRLRLAWSLYAHTARITQTRLASSGQQVLERLATACGESAWLVVRQGADAVTVAEAIPPTSVLTVSWVGRSFPIARSDAGAMLMVDLSGPDLDELLGDAPLPRSRAPRAPRSIRGVKRLIADAKAADYSVIDEQTEPGLASVAAPVRDFRSRLVAAVVVTGPASRIRSRLPDTIDATVGAAADLSAELGSGMIPLSR
jgi:IclR family transcriptional regulator, KDG regulon repressor